MSKINQHVINNRCEKLASEKVDSEKVRLRNRDRAIGQEGVGGEGFPPWGLGGSKEKEKGRNGKNKERKEEDKNEERRRLYMP